MSTASKSLSKAQVIARLDQGDISAATQQALYDLLAHAVKKDYLQDMGVAANDESRIAVARNYLDFARKS